MLLRSPTLSDGEHPGHGREALHLFYGDVDLRADHEIEEVFAEDEVPATLHFRDLEEFLRTQNQDPEVGQASAGVASITAQMEEKGATCCQAIVSE